MEYLAKQAGTRVFNRKSQKIQNQHLTKPESADLCEADLFAMVEELKFIVPVAENRNRINELWESTFAYRCQYRANNDVLSFLEEFPVSIAFLGELIEYDYQRLTGRNIVFVNEWSNWQQKVLHAHKYMFKEISDGIYEYRKTG
ncbi:uncharacterized protein LOC5579883 [Aedes aegypti]|uniref:Uncharacterized protein n=1 Tax=Aedes aegypti TaxID=7159 RepID=A0A6I8U1G9_AEDAE|nr:uncharacterized protein LOC5579883 [Aedes aegypti]